MMKDFHNWSNQHNIEVDQEQEDDNDSVKIVNIDIEDISEGEIMNKNPMLDHEEDGFGLESA